MTRHPGAVQDPDFLAERQIACRPDRVVVQRTASSQPPRAGAATDRQLDRLAAELGRQAARDLMSRGRSLWEIAACLALVALLGALLPWFLR